MLEAEYIAAGMAEVHPTTGRFCLARRLSAPYVVSENEGPGGDGVSGAGGNVLHAG